MPTSLGNALSGVFTLLQERGHAGYAIVCAAIIEQRLLDALLMKMRPLNAKLRTRLFGDYGALSSFAAKIDLSYALGLIDEVQHNDLTVVRKIRNAFAHSRDLVHFTSEEIRVHFTHFDSFPETVADYQKYYLTKLQGIERHLDRIVSAAVAPTEQK